MTDLVTFLRDRIDEDEAAAESVHANDCDVHPNGWTGDVGPCDCGYPARVLADVAAKRAIVDMHWQWADDDGSPLALCDACSDEWPCRTLRHLAYAYHVAGAEGWREEWRP